MIYYIIRNTSSKLFLKEFLGDEPVWARTARMYGQVPASDLDRARTFSPCEIVILKEQANGFPAPASERQNEHTLKHRPHRANSPKP